MNIKQKCISQLNMKNNISGIHSLFLMAFVVFLAGCSDKEWDNHTASEANLRANILEVLQSNPNLSIFSQVLKKTGYDNLLSLAVNYTVFAPSNSAWDGIDTTDVSSLKKVIAYQICLGKNLSSDSNFYKNLTMLDTKHLRYDSSSSTFADASVTSADNVAGNGVVHVTNKLFERKDNIYEYITSTYSDLQQVKYLISLNKQVMDADKSVQVGVSNGKIVYDTVWTNVNAFLKESPIDNEDSVMTYVVLKNPGFQSLYSKYSPYFVQSTDAKTDSAVHYNVCQDFVISLSGKVDISQYDTITNAYGLKVPIAGSTITDTYEASNGRVYVIDQSNILLREKIQPILIQGEDYLAASDTTCIYKRYRTWASGKRDVMVNCRNYQTDTIHSIGSKGQDSTSISTKTFYWDASNYLANVINFYLKYKAKVNSVGYNVYYVAYDDIGWHYSDANQIFRLKQKLYASMPGSIELSKGTGTYVNAVVNNYLGDKTCFVGINQAGVHQETKLAQWNLANNTTQLISSKVTTANSDVMTVPKSGNLTLWLCNTAESTASSAQGMMFVDYIKLVPILPAE
jgi:uncharacterized surface protein with fasciclin (FAS1) repeats